jgi:hypothetical protein
MVLLGKNNMKEFKASTEYQPVIGFEIHVQLATKSKMFGRAANNPDQKSPNVDIDEVNTGQPGTLPVANKEAIRLAAMVGLALNCTIDEWSKFDRKHYFYPDLPKGYQISQYDQPISRDGFLEVFVPGNTTPSASASTPPILGGELPHTIRYGASSYCKVLLISSIFLARSSNCLFKSSARADSERLRYAVSKSFPRAVMVL